jgi:YVTN family beta-propeller protein
VADGEVVRIDPGTIVVVARVDVGLAPRHVALGFGSLWVTNYGSATITRIDPDNNQIVATIDVGLGPEGITFDDRDVWIANRSAGTVSRIDPATNHETSTINVGSLPEGLASGDDGRLWVALSGTDAVVPIDAATQRVGPRLATEREPRRLLLRDDQLWVSNTSAGTVTVHLTLP